MLRKERQTDSEKIVKKIAEERDRKNNKKWINWMERIGDE